MDASRQMDTQDTQLALPFGMAQADIARRFEQALGSRVSVTLTDNARSLFSMRHKPLGEVVVRIHRLFLGADVQVIEELARYARTKRGKTPLFWNFVKLNSEKLNTKPTRKRTVTIHAKGEVYDLGEIMAEVNQEYFPGASVVASITWGAGRQQQRRARRVTLGSYVQELNLIRINPSLDRRAVPRYYIEFIVYHEMLHAHLGIGRSSGGRRVVHPRQFRELERRHKDYDLAIKWERGAK